MKNNFTQQDTSRFIKMIGLDLNSELFNLDDLTYGLNVELEHGRVDPFTDVTHNDLLQTGKIALAHLREFPDYYRRLKKMEKEADKFWEGKQKRRRRRYILVKTL